MFFLILREYLNEKIENPDLFLLKKFFNEKNVTNKKQIEEREPVLIPTIPDLNYENILIANPTILTDMIEDDNYDLLSL